MNLNEYIELNEVRKTILKDIEAYEQNINSLKEELSEIRKMSEKEIEYIKLNKSQTLRKNLDDQIRNSTLSETKKLDELKTQFLDLEKNRGRFKAKGNSDFFIEYIKAYENCSYALSEISSNKSLISKIIDNEYDDLSKENLDSLCDICEDGCRIIPTVNIHIDTESKLTALFNNIVKLSLILKYLDNTQRIPFLVSYYIAMTILFIVNINILIYFYLITFSYFIYKDLNPLIKSLTGLKKIEYYKRASKELKVRVSEEISKLNKIEEEKLNTELNSKSKYIKEQICSLENNINEIAENIKKFNSENVDKDKIIEEEVERAKSRFKVETDNLEERIKSLMGGKTELENEYEENLKNLDKGKQELIDTYFTLNLNSKNKILPDKLLLSFEDYNPNTISFDNYTLNVIFDEKNKDGNKDFITMCIIQLLCSISPSSVKFNIVDLKNSTSDYGIFQSAPDIFSVITTLSELEKEIDRLYEIKVERDYTIKMQANSINEYNKKMIDNYGVPMLYEVLIIANPIEELIENNKFKQILKSGSIGLVTINTLPKSILNFSQMENKELERVIEFITEYVNDLKSYTLSGLVTYDRNELITKINKTIRERRLNNV